MNPDLVEVTASAIEFEKEKTNYLSDSRRFLGWIIVICSQCFWEDAWLQGELVKIKLWTWNYVDNIRKSSVLARRRHGTKRHRTSWTFPNSQMAIVYMIKDDDRKYYGNWMPSG